MGGKETAVTVTVTEAREGQGVKRVVVEGWTAQRLECGHWVAPKQRVRERVCPVCKQEGKERENEQG